MANTMGNGQIQVELDTIFTIRQHGRTMKLFSISRSADIVCGTGRAEINTPCGSTSGPAS